MDRRTFIAGMTGGLLGAPLAVGAQPAGKRSRIGILMNLYSPDADPPQALARAVSRWAVYVPCDLSGGACGAAVNDSKRRLMTDPES